MGTLNTLTGLFGSGWREVEFENSDDIPDKEDDMKKKHLQPLTPAALYARVSSDRQDVDLSVSAQLRALKDYAKANDYSVAREYVDEAESGRVADRPQFREMIEEGSQPKAPFEVILVWKFSRFTRKREHAVAFKSMLLAQGVQVSMDGRGRCMVNVFVERLWRSIKYEEVYLKAYQNGTEARKGIGAYLAFYNQERPHQALGYRSPGQVFQAVSPQRCLLEHPRALPSDEGLRDTPAVDSLILASPLS